MAPLKLAPAHGGPGRRKPGESGIGWFCSAVRPDAPRVLRQYAAAPPRGMTNPPQNPAVRQALLRDLIENGIVLEGRTQWPPPLISPKASNSTTPLAEPAPTPGARRSMAGSSPSKPIFKNCAAVSGGAQVLGYGGARSLPQLESMPSGPLKQAGRQLLRRPADRSSATLAHAGAEVGRQHGLAAAHLQPLQNTPLGAAGGRKNGASPPLSPGGARSRAESVLSQHCDTGRESEGASGSGDKAGRESAFPQGRSRKDLSEQEMCYAIDSLRHKGRSHRVAHETRFQMSDDPVDNAPPQGGIRSDGAHLVSHHNKAMRSQNPSQLDVLPPEVKKKKHHYRFEDDEEHLGLSRVKYTSDSSLRSLRELRMKMGPSSHEVDQAEAAAHAIEERKQKVITDLKANLNFNLSSFRTIKRSGSKRDSVTIEHEAPFK